MKRIYCIYLPLLLLIPLFFLNGCKNSSTNSETNDVISGIYKLSGEKIRTRYSDWPIPEGEHPVIDTVGVSFLLKIEPLNDGKGTFRLYGLESVDIGKNEKKVFPDCIDPKDCPFFGKVVGESFEILVSENERTYHATGFIYQRYTPYINLTATYQHQNYTMQYTVEGSKKTY